MPALFPELVALTKNKDLEKLTVAMRQYFGEGGGRSPFLDMDKMLKHFDIPLGVCRENFGTVVMDDRQATLKSLMQVNPHLSFLEDRFTKAHLLGHYILHLQILAAQGEQAILGFADDRSPMQRFELGAYETIQAKVQKEEQEADCFAASLLMPKAMFEVAFKKFASLSKMAHFFGVSEEVVSARRQMLDQKITVAIRPRAQDSSKNPYLPKDVPQKKQENKTNQVKTIFTKEQAKKLSLDKIRAIAKKIDQRAG